MKASNLDRSLAGIETHWSALFKAHQGQGDSAMAALQEMLMRYYGAVYRYLLGILGDSHAAEDLTNDFAARFLQGGFRNADPSKGRFRDFLRMSLRNLARDYWDRKNRQNQKEGKALPPSEVMGGNAFPTQGETDRLFNESCAADILDRTYRGLAQEEKENRNHYFSALTLRTSHLDLTDENLAVRLSEQVGKPVSGDSFRKTLERARKRFADLLLSEIGRRIGSDDLDSIEEELIELKLHPYCKSALKRRREDKASS